MTHTKAIYQTPQAIDASVFRAYDIRGNATTQLTPDLVYAIGLAIAAEAKQIGQANIAVGRDGRVSSPALAKALIAGLCAGGLHVLDVGVCASPVLYYATYSLDTKAGVIVTGSHNPKQDNGLKK